MKELVKSLKETNQYENSIIIFISDNGANRYGSNGQLIGNKGGAYEGGSRIPAIICYPNKIKKGTINKVTTLSMDLLPTLLDFINKKPSNKNIDGVSIKEGLINNEKAINRDLFYSFGNNSFIRNTNWKMIKTSIKNGCKYELYDLESD